MASDKSTSWSYTEAFASEDEVPERVREACLRGGLPLVEVPGEVSFGTIGEVVTRRLTAERAAGLATVLGRHRRLISSVAEGAGPVRAQDPRWRERQSRVRRRCVRRLGRAASAPRRSTLFSSYASKLPSNQYQLAGFSSVPS